MPEKVLCFRGILQYSIIGFMFTVEGSPGDTSMADDRAQKLQAMAGNGVLTCTQIYTFARNNAIELQYMKPLLRVAGIRVKDCEQTCISLRCKYFK
jgi:hypothetical protein